MTIQEKFDTLTPKQREKLGAVKTEQELDTFLAETGIEPTAEERAMLSMHLKSKTGELSDDEVAEAAGGSGWKKCPMGHYEATAIANILECNYDCEIGICNQFKRKFLSRKDVNRPSSTSPDKYSYMERCDFFNRECKRSSDYELLTNWGQNA